MKKVVNVVIVMAAVLSLSSCFSRQENLLSRFADPKEEYAMLLEGMVNYKGDRVIFDLLPASPLACDDDDKDIILVISDGDTCEFTREMISDANVPAPGKDGRKFMSWWQTAADYSPDFDGKLAAKEKKFFQIFKQVVKHGQIEYGMFNDAGVFRPNRGTKENFILTYDKTPEEAAKLAAKVSQPLFSRRGL